ncbi:SAF domain-containing protein [Krasilnikoviella flava]|uniref:Flp pilus assembly protein CpaB n=1 Tax=Krasilnikoviella flava TaxID=526729 RepID=A0A1T5IH37_9MICO|nr:SAF domain-containing protein [Krasilnikoviella flava]SKC38457.1 Flp pilus assembly protein CpaB [Krasilnikoviella flava]
MPLPDTLTRPSARRRPDGSSGPPGRRPEEGAPGGRRPLARRLRSLLWRTRFLLAAACCGLAAAAVVQAVRPAPPPTVDVVVPAHALPAGEPVTAADLTTVPVAAELAPDGVATDPADLVGLTPATVVPAGLPLHPELLPGGGVVARAPKGTVVVPVRLDDVAAGWLRPGDRVDLVVTGEAAGTGDDDAAGDHAYLARRALVLPRPAGTDRTTSGGLLGGATGSPEGTGVTLVAVAADEAPGVSAASGWGTVGAVLVR